MHFDKIKNKGQGRLFQSEYLEMMTNTHPIVIYSLYIPIVIFLLYYAFTYRFMSIGVVFLFFLGGILAWSLMEYVLHRFIFHYVTENPKLQRVVYKLHGIH